MTVTAIRNTLCALLAVLSVACIDERCDDGTTFEVGLCRTVIPDARISVGSDGGEDAAPVATSVPYLTSCTDPSGCGGVTNFCAVQPGQSVGFCTMNGCVEDPSVCPSGASCLDLAPYGAAGMSICIGGGS